MCLQGEMTIVVKFGGDPIANSPFKVGVAAPLDLNKVNVDNLEGSKKSLFLCFQLTFHLTTVKRLVSKHLKCLKKVKFLSVNKFSRRQPSTREKVLFIIHKTSI